MVLLTASSNSIAKSPLVQELISELERQEVDSNQVDLMKNNKYPSFITSLLHRFHGKSKQSKETVNPSVKPQQGCDPFSALPAELIHIILSYYAHSFQHLIKFSAINKACKQISEHSLLWLEVKLMFYPPRSYLHRKGYYQDSTYKCYEEFIETQIRANLLSILEKQLFSTETKFPPVYNVSVIPFRQDLTQYKEFPKELDYEISYRVGKWWKALFVEYQRLYHQHVDYVASLNSLYEDTKKIININPSFEYFLLLTSCVGIVSIYLLFDCNNTKLSLKNKIGLYLLLCLVGLYLILNLIYIMNSLAKGLIENKETLLFPVKYSYISGLDTYFAGLTSVLISLMLALSKCDNSPDKRMDWWETTLPLWIGFCLIYGLWYYEKRKNSNERNVFVDQVSGAYITCSVPLTFTLIAFYYDNIYTGPFQYTLFPLYPVFLLAIIALGYRVYKVGRIFYTLLRGRRIASIFSYNEWLNSATYFCIVSLTNISITINCWSIIMLLIDSYMIENNDWDKRFFSIHFTPITCFLIFLFSCPCIYLGIFVENTKFYFEDRWVNLIDFWVSFD